MRLIDIVPHLDPAEHGRRDQERLVAFIDELAAAHGARPLSDHLWLDLVAGGAPGFVAVTASTLADGTARLAGLAQVSAANDGVVLEVVTRPSHQLADAEAVALDLADTALDTVRRRDRRRLTWWVDDATPAIAELAASHGLTLERALHEMRRPLPHPDRSAVETRAFVPGADDAAWLAVNNRAFADHGEQGGWTDATLALRIGEPWFDPDGFRLHEADDRLIGFCWTKVHTESDPPLGEIYAIAVDPEVHGRGLGRELTLAGLDSLADRGIRHANLYVDTANAPAIRLYERLGFTVHRTRSAYAGRLDRP